MPQNSALAMLLRSIILTQQKKYSNQKVSRVHEANRTCVHCMIDDWEYQQGHLLHYDVRIYTYATNIRAQITPMELVGINHHSYDSEYRKDVHVTIRIKP